MAGVKGKSGRRSHEDEAVRRRVLDKCWKLLERDLDNPKVSDEVKRDIALKLAPKSIPTELSGGFTADVTAMGTIERVVGEVTEVLTFNIGSSD
jgi:hypothetical protein